MHRIDFELASDVSQEELRERLNTGSQTAKWTGRDSEYLGVYTMARFDNKAVAKIFQPGGGEVFEVEIAAPTEVPDAWLEELRESICAVFEAYSNDAVSQ